MFVRQCVGVETDFRRLCLLVARLVGGFGLALGPEWSIPFGRSRSAVSVVIYSFCRIYARPQVTFTVFQATDFLNDSLEIFRHTITSVAVSFIVFRHRALNLICAQC